MNNDTTCRGCHSPLPSDAKEELYPQCQRNREVSASKRRFRCLNAAALVFLALPTGVLVLVILWCKLDGCVTIHGFHPALRELWKPAVHDVYVYPVLEYKGDLVRGRGRLFKERVTLRGPCILYITLRNYGKPFEKIRVTSCKIYTPDKSFEQQLMVLPGNERSIPFLSAPWNNDFTGKDFIALIPSEKPSPWPVPNLVVPPAATKFLLDIELECVSKGTTETAKKTYTLGTTVNSYSSDGLNTAIAL